MFMKKGVYMRYVIGALIGAGAGYILSLVTKCTTGTCPLTSNAFTTVLIGIFAGIMLAAKPPIHK